MSKSHKKWSRFFFLELGRPSGHRLTAADRISRNSSLFRFKIQRTGSDQIQWKLDLADTSLAENLGLKKTLQKIWATVFDF